MCFPFMYSVSMPFLVLYVHGEQRFCCTTHIWVLKHVFPPFTFRMVQNFRDIKENRTILKSKEMSSSRRKNIVAHGELSTLITCVILVQGQC
ncbi:hypothetical protein DL96DRAFT_731396 [Flagelloscypha sp. PMI_526]|nr:hypothetical protein DL96DRAFT_731396 [Flagelloscypha sp. PMI_526]